MNDGSCGHGFDPTMTALLATPTLDLSDWADGLGCMTPKRQLPRTSRSPVRRIVGGRRKIPSGIGLRPKLCARCKKLQGGSKWLRSLTQSESRVRAAKRLRISRDDDSASLHRQVAMGQSRGRIFPIVGASGSYPVLHNRWRTVCITPPCPSR